MYSFYLLFLYYLCSVQFLTYLLTYLIKLFHRFFLIEINYTVTKHFLQLFFKLLFVQVLEKKFGD